MTLRRFVLGLAFTLAAFAAPPAGGAEVEGCPGLVASMPAILEPAAFATRRLGPGLTPAPSSAPAEGQVGLTFVGHATFLIESAKGVRIATDYSDSTRPAEAPDVATMNKAHSTHFSHRPDPRIRHVLR